MFLSEAPDFGANRCKGTIFVLLLAEGIGIRPVGRIHRFLQQVRKVMIEARSGRARLRHYIGCNVPSVFGGESWIEIVGAVRHIEVDEVAMVISRAIPAPSLKLSAPHSGGIMYPRSEEGMLRRTPDPSVLWQSAHRRA